MNDKVNGIKIDNNLDRKGDKSNNRKNDKYYDSKVGKNNGRKDDKKRNNTLNILSIIFGLIVIVTSLITLFYSNGGKSFEVKNMYGDIIKIYGDGIYKNNSILAVSSYFGTDVVRILEAVILITLTLWKKRPLWAEIIRTSTNIPLLYSSFYNVFGTSMNRLYLIYVVCFIINVYLVIYTVKQLFAMIEVPLQLKEKSMKGTGIFLIISSTLTASVWLSLIIPAIISGDFGFLEIQTNEVTYGIDLCFTCPSLILCGIWLIQKKEIGYKIAPLLLYLLTSVGILVLIQRAYCIKLGVEIPIQALISMIIVFVILGAISLYLMIKLIMQLKSRG